MLTIQKVKSYTAGPYPMLCRSTGGWQDQHRQVHRQDPRQGVHQDILRYEVYLANKIIDPIASSQN